MVDPSPGRATGRRTRANRPAAIPQAGSEFGGALGNAILGSLGTAIYRGELAGSMPAGVSPSAAEAARETLGGAVAVAQALPGQLGAALVDTARAAFSQSFEVTSAVGALLLAAVAIAAGVLLRGDPTSGRP